MQINIHNIKTEVLSYIFYKMQNAKLRLRFQVSGVRGQENPVTQEFSLDVPINQLTRYTGGINE
jgi:hypothetical protein